jgi:hypothetical protein
MAQGNVARALRHLIAARSGRRLPRGRAQVPHEWVR